MLNNSLDSFIGFQSRYNNLEKRAGFTELTAGLPKPEDMSDLEYELMHNKAKFLKDSLNKSVDTLLDYYDKEKMNPVKYFLHKNKDDLMTYGGLGAGALGLGVGGLALYLRHKDKKKKEREMQELGLGKEASDKLSLLKRLSTGAKDFMTSSTNKISEGINHIMHTPFSKKEMRNTIIKAKRDGGILYDLFYKDMPKKTRRQMIRNTIYEKRMEILNKLKPYLRDSVIGGSGLGVGYLLGSESDDSE